MKNENGKSKVAALLWIAFILILAVVVIAAVLVFGQKFNWFNKGNSEEPAKTNEVVTPSPKPSVKPTEPTEGINVVPTMSDEIKADTAYVPTFQLVWNDMMDEVVKQDVEFIEDEEPDYLDNLNDQLFKEEDISDEYIYKKFGVTSNDLKEEILEGIKEKFDETSDVIDPDEDWGEPSEDEDSTSYTFYTMLKRVFKFENPFDKFEEDEHFGKNIKYSNVKYFGINGDSDSKLYDQVEILFYENINEFAFMLYTKDGDQLIFAKGVDGDTFEDIYSTVAEKSESFEGRTKFESDDLLKVPNLDLNVLKDYEEVCKKPFYTKKGSIAIITKALQTIKFTLDNEGGKIVSEAIIQMKDTATSIEDEPPVTYTLVLNDEFTMFVKEENKDKPYFALRVSDISKYQKDVEEE